MPPVIRKQVSARPDGALGEWRDGAFHFDSPEAEQKWRIDAYRSGVHAENWHLGQVLDPKTRDVVLGGLGGPTPPYYRGPDGAYRFANRQTIEPADVRDLRKQSFQNAKVRDIQGPAMPGEDVIAARFDAKLQRQSANDNIAPPANDNSPPVTEGVPKPRSRAIGRFAEMAAAQKSVPHPSLEETAQAIDDGIRLLANGFTIGYADNVAAAGNALFGPGSFAEDYEKNLLEERAQTDAARQRTGTIGAMIEAAPGLIPVYGDGLSLLSDAKQYIEHPETATVGNILGTVATALPFTPNALGVARKVENTVEGAAKLEAKVAGKIDDVPAAPKVEPESPQDLPAIKPDQIRIDINDPASIDAYFKRPIKGNEGPDGHVLSKHVGKTKEELLERLRNEPDISGSSSFYDIATADRALQEGLMQRQSQIVDWLKNPHRETYFFNFDAGKPIGITVRPDGTVLDQVRVRIGLKKDGKGGFYFFTAYPQ